MALSGARVEAIGAKMTTTPMTAREEDDVPRGRRRMRLAAVVLGLLVALTLAEVVVRTVAPFPWYPEPSVTPLAVHHPRYGWTGEVSSRTTFTQHEFRIEVVNDEAGFRDEPLAVFVARAGDRRRVLVLGDSFAWGWGVPEHQRVGERLDELDPGRAVWTRAQPGYGLDQELLVLQDVLPRVRAADVVVLLHPNDFLTVVTDQAYGAPKPLFRVADDGLALTNVPLRERKDPLSIEAPAAAQSSSIADVLYRSHVVNWARHAVRGPPTTAASHAASTRLEDWSAASDLVERLLAELVAECQAHGARPLLVLIPTAEQLAGATDDAWQEPVLAICERVGLSVLDLRPVLVGRSRARFHHDRHWTAHGHALAARAIADTLGR